MRSARLLAGLWLVLLFAVAAACGGDDDAGPSGDDPSADGGESAAGGGDGGEGADEADGPTAADGGDRLDSSEDDDTDSADTERPAVDPSIEVPEWVVVIGVDEALNARAGPSSSFDRVAQIPPGETLRVLGGAESDEGGLWLQVVIGGETEGWVFAQFTTQIARPTPTPLPTPTPVGTPTPLPTADGDGDGDQTLRVVAPDGLRLRDGPGLDTEVIAELDDGDRVEATGRTRIADGRDWTEVRVGGRTGWVASEFVR